MTATVEYTRAFPPDLNPVCDWCGGDVHVFGLRARDDGGRIRFKLTLCVGCLCMMASDVTDWGFTKQYEAWLKMTTRHARRLVNRRWKLQRAAAEDDAK